MKFRNLPLLSFIVACAAGRAGFFETEVQAAARAPAFQAIASGEMADVNAKDGDAAFNSDYFASLDFTGKPVTRISMCSISDSKRPA